MLKSFSRCLSYKLLICTYNTTRSYSLINSGKVLRLKNNQSFLLSPSCTTNMSTNIKPVNYEDIVKMKDNKEVLLIDVREPSELQETGVLPGSINIPVGEVESVLKNTSPGDFLKKFGRPKPDVDFPITFSCKAGGRSKNAANIAIQLGYKNVHNYLGGWLDYEKNQSSN